MLTRCSPCFNMFQVSQHNLVNTDLAIPMDAPSGPQTLQSCSSKAL